MKKKMNRQSSVLRHVTFLGTRIFLSWRTWAEASSRSLPKERQRQPGTNKTLSVYLPLLCSGSHSSHLLSMLLHWDKGGGLPRPPPLLSSTVEKERMEGKRWSKARITEWRGDEILLRLCRLGCREEPLLTLSLPPFRVLCFLPFFPLPLLSRFSGLGDIFFSSGDTVVLQ